jgi:hypothetical protein
MCGSYQLYGRRTPYLKGGISQRARLIIGDRDEFNELWQQIMRQVSNKPPLLFDCQKQIWPVVFRETEFTCDCNGLLRPVGKE